MDVDEDEFLGVLQASSKKFSEDWVIPHRVLRDWMWSLRFLNPELQEDFVDTFQAGDLFLEMIDALLAPNARGKEKPSGGQYHVNPKSLFQKSQNYELACEVLGRHPSCRRENLATVEEFFFGGERPVVFFALELFRVCALTPARQQTAEVLQWINDALGQRYRISLPSLESRAAMQEMRNGKMLCCLAHAFFPEYLSLADVFPLPSSRQQCLRNLDLALDTFLFYSMPVFLDVDDLFDSQRFWPFLLVQMHILFHRLRNLQTTISYIQEKKK